MFENLTLAAVENPVLLAFVIAVLRVVLGYLGNRFRNSMEKFDVGRFGETLMWWETFLVLISQYPGFGVEGAVAVTAVLDVVRTASKLLKGKE
ncbi:hypothetical protein KEJ37_00370 [Candidatus Bathyarchaeota archaeon]|nr:hypothetical protein [Candidatus Bathyarchaeota archaeon]